MSDLIMYTSKANMEALDAAIMKLYMQSDYERKIKQRDREKTRYERLKHLYKHVTPMFIKSKK